MRNILFRGKRIDNGKWIYGGCFTVGSKYFICRANEQVQVDSRTVGQFTGLVDKNCIKIFEDDIVEVEVYRCLEYAFVTYFNSCFFICGLDGKGIPLFEYIDKESGKVEKAEVIGNTRDNWELLEEQ